MNGGNVPHSQRAIESIVMLYCALVGVEWIAFSIDIDARKPVGRLKNAMQAKNEETITCEADELELSLELSPGEFRKD